MYMRILNLLMMQYARMTIIRYFIIFKIVMNNVIFLHVIINYLFLQILRNFFYKHQKKKILNLIILLS